ncbi:hypothetical protein [Antarcticirhabdus aurantiaca]|uniref:Uncharacterized protein n=1 Tax=Antarcticirhabdus aurantiaca TaxID=2606717 RepID=A0ACD4NQX1_9HYPH|nr:hypothetical protein OXU80_03445 [Jeongeuplla avenae]
MKASSATHSPHITTDRIERALNRLAQIITEAGSDGAAYLPIYDRLEAELATAKKTDDRLAAIYARSAALSDTRICKRTP